MPGPARALSPPGVSYTIDVRLDPARHRLTGWATLRYTSGADTALPALYFHTYPNAFRDHRTIYGQEAEKYGNDYGIRLSSEKDRGWMTLDSCTVDGAPAAVAIPAAIGLDQTLARVDLPRPLEPGATTEVRLHFVVQVPKHFDRIGRAGSRYSMSQWYPKIVVYDSRGWRLDPFHFFSEFYGEFGTYDVAITLPDRYWVGSTGVLRGVQGGDNEIPLFASRTSKDSVTVSLRVVTADSLANHWPPGGLEVKSDLHRPEGKKRPEPPPLVVPRDEPLRVRVPRGAPVHYSYAWKDDAVREHGKRGAKRDGASGDGGGGNGGGVSGGGHAREEADEQGRPGPLHLIVATSDTAVTDTLRTLAPAASPTDTTAASEKTLRYHAERIHDFAWVAAPDYVRSDSTRDGIALRTLAFREDEKDWRVVNETVARAMDLYTRLAGPYVWPQFTYTEAFCGGGAMEYNMLVMAEPEFRSTLFHFMENTIAHELAHNWFYGMIGTDERAFPWLDEGFAQYFDHRYTDETFPRGMFAHLNRAPWLSGYTMRSRDERDYMDRAWARDERPLTTPANGHTGYPTYAVSAYTKPMSMLHTLRGVLGDSVFTAFLHTYYRRGVLRHPMPGEVRAAAEEASGWDLSGFFHSWVETLDRPSFGLSRGSSKRTGDEYVSVLRVERKGEMAFPVRVEARFKDGSVEERSVIPVDRTTKIEFTSRSKLDGGTLDPRHEIVELDRLDNHVGGFWSSPIHVRPLYGFPSADAIGVDAGPTFWYGTDEGVRLGAWLDGRYLPSQDVPYGIRGFEAGLNVGTNDGSIAYRVGSWSRWGAIGARSRVRWLVADDEGLFRTLVSAENVAMGSGRRYPYRSWRFAVEYRNREDLAPVNPAYWSERKTVEPRLELGLDTRGPRRSERYRVTYAHGFDPDAFPNWSDNGFDRLLASVHQSLDLMPRGDLHVGWRAAAGGAWGSVPAEVRMDVAEESRLEALRYFYANDLGPIRNTDHYYLPGGGGLRGYADRAILGDRLLAFDLEARHSAYPIHLFAGVARVRNYVPEQYLEFESPQSRTYSEAGVGYTYGPVQLDFPVWLGTPDPGESPWKVRWRFTFLPLRIPRL